MSIKYLINIKHLRLVTFDITGTLLQVKLEPYAEISSQYGISIQNSEKLAVTFKKHFTHWYKKHPNFGKYSGLGWENWWKNVVTGVLKDQNQEISAEKLDQIATTLIKTYNTTDGWRILPGTLDTLEYLTNRGIILGAISNFDQRLETILTNTGIRKYFSFIITSYDFGKEKPDSAIFQEALKLGIDKHGDDILPTQALHIGDSVKLDYNGAKNAGWNAFLIDYSNANEKLNPVLGAEKFKNLDELQNCFKIFL